MYTKNVPFLFAITLFYMAITKAAPVSENNSKCNEHTPLNYARLMILVKLYDDILPKADILKEKTAKYVIERFRPYVDEAPKLNGFPELSPDNTKCAACDQIEACFTSHCAPLESLLKFINTKMSPDYATDIEVLSRHLSNMVQQMNCRQEYQPSFEGEDQTSDKNYKIATDTVKFLNTIKNMYSPYSNDV